MVNPWPILFQFPLGGICLIFILLTRYLSSKIPNIRIIMLVLCCLPVIAGCTIIWKSTSSYQAAAPVVGYSIIEFMGAFISLTISLGMSIVAGHTKKCFMAATIFVAYCVGNILGPQLIIFPKHSTIPNYGLVSSFGKPIPPRSVQKMHRSHASN